MVLKENCIFAIVMVEDRELISFAGTAAGVIAGRGFLKLLAASYTLSMLAIVTVQHVQDLHASDCR